MDVGGDLMWDLAGTRVRQQHRAAGLAGEQRQKVVGEALFELRERSVQAEHYQYRVGGARQMCHPAVQVANLHISADIKSMALLKFGTGVEQASKGVGHFRARCHWTLN